MKKIFLDSVELDKQQVKSFVNIIYNLLITNRSNDANNFKLSFDQLLERQYITLNEDNYQQIINKQIEQLMKDIEKNKTNQFSINFKISAYIKSEKNILFSYVKKKRDSHKLEEYSFPVTLQEQGSSNLSTINENLSKKIYKILQHIQQDQRNLFTLNNLIFEVKLSNQFFLGAKKYQLSVSLKTLFI